MNFRTILQTKRGMLVVIIDLLRFIPDRTGGGAHWVKSESRLSALPIRHHWYFPNSCLWLFAAGAATVLPRDSISCLWWCSRGQATRTGCRCKLMRERTHTHQGYTKAKWRGGGGIRRDGLQWLFRASCLFSVIASKPKVPRIAQTISRRNQSLMSYINRNQPDSPSPSLTRVFTEQLVLKGSLRCANVKTRQVESSALTSDTSVSHDG